MKKDSNIFVFCHDAGGAEIISAYVKRYADQRHFFCMPQGPATAIFKKKGIRGLMDGAKNPVQALRALADIGTVLLGTSWVNSDWVRVIATAKRRGIKTVVYLDHWMNDKRRFHNTRYFYKHLPDEFWAGDRYALRLAKRAFPKTPVRFVANEYFRETKKEFRARRARFAGTPDAVLFLSSPASVFWKNKKLRFNEFDVLENILRGLAGARKKRPVIIRLHPLEEARKYARVLVKYFGVLSVTVSSHTNILDDIVRARTVVGLESTALVVAHLCGKRVLSCVPLAGQNGVLPFPGIKKITNLAVLSRLLSITS